MGTSRCPCITADNENKSHFEQICRKVTFSQNISDNSSAYPPVTDCLSGTNDAYGFSCKLHEIEGLGCDQRMELLSKSCKQEWCFVDRDECFLSNETYFEDYLFPGYYFSYSTCSPQSLQSFNELDVIDNPASRLSGKEVIIVVAESSYPLHFLSKDNLHNEDHENESVSIYEMIVTNGTGSSGDKYYGASIDFFVFVLQQLEVSSFKVITPSGGAINARPSNYWDASVLTVMANLAHFSMSPMWVTTERSSQVGFTIPIYNSHFYLFQVNKKGLSILEKIGDSIRNTLKPFENSLWFVTIGCVGVVALLSVYFATSRNDDKKWHQALRNYTWKSSSRLRRARIITQVFSDSTMHTFNSCFGGGTEINMFSALSIKILMFGFGFFLLLINSSYTANLATFLSKPNIEISWALTMDKAVEQNMTICVAFGMESKIQSVNQGKWENASLVIIHTPASQYVDSALNHMKQRKCSVFISEEYAMNFLSKSSQKELCDEKIVSTKEILFTENWSFNVRPQYSATLSQAILKLQENGITYEEFLKPYITPRECQNIYLINDSDSSSNNRLTFSMMILPFLWLWCCILLATCIEFRPKGMQGFKGFKKEMDQHTLEDGNNNERSTYDLYEYKYRVDLLSLELSQISYNIECDIAAEEDSSRRKNR